MRGWPPINRLRTLFWHINHAMGLNWGCSGGALRKGMPTPEFGKQAHLWNCQGCGRTYILFGDSPPPVR